MDGRAHYTPKMLKCQHLFREKAKKDGDENVYFIDGETLFGEEDRDFCTVDRFHPNDLGFYRFAENLNKYINF